MIERLLSVADAAERLGVSARRVRQLIDLGELEASQVGRAWMVHPGSVERRRLQPAVAGRPLDKKRAWSLAFLADELFQQLKEGMALHDASDLLRLEEAELARRLEEPLSYLRDLEPEEIAADRRHRVGAERAFRDGLDVLRDFKGREKLLDSMSALFEIENEASTRHRPQPPLLKLDDQEERAASRKLKDILAHGEVGPSQLAPFRNRSEGVLGYYGHPSVLPSLASEDRLVLSGAHAAAHYGADIVPGDELDAYVDVEDIDAVVQKHGLEDAPLGEANIWLRPAGEFSSKPGWPPRLLVAADLLERADERRRSAALQLLELVVAAVRMHGEK